VIEVGTVLAGKYRVDRVIGRGGMGMVVGATHLHLQQPVALKFLLPDLLHAPLIVERFVREARASAQLRGEHVCRVSDVGTFDNGAPYIVMELLHGSDLATLLHRGGPLAIQAATDHVLQACVGVAEAHAAGIIHRDLKPANLFLTRRPDGTPLIKVLDFGIAKAQNEQSFSLTQTNAVLGSPGYMSPEQLRSTRNADARSDIWSIGVILFELVTGRPPFTGESVTELALHIAMDPTPAMFDGMPHEFERVVQRCLAKDPAQRYADLAELAAALVPFAGPYGRELAAQVARQLRVARPSAASPVAGAAPTGTTEAHLSTPTTMRSAASQINPGATGRRRRWGVVAGAAGTVLAAAVVTLMIARGGDKLASPQAANAPAASAPPASAPVANPPAASASPASAPVANPPAASASPASPPVANPPAGAANPPASPPTANPPTPAAAVDAGVPDADVPPDAAPKKPKPPKPPAGKPATTDPGADLGNSRF
jgi:serine/threonine-protein kinase